MQTPSLPMNEAAVPKASPRIDLVDALRGSALLGILLIHSMEHFNLMRYPSFSPEWVGRMDGWVRDSCVFLFGGKAYSLFALMFGLSFFLILDRSKKRGVNFRWRFLWRLVVLEGIGLVHSLLYGGDILTVLAALGLLLVVFEGWGNRVLLGVAVLALLQLPQLWQFGHLLTDPAYVPAPAHATPYARQLAPVYASGDFLELLRGNAMVGQLRRAWWNFESGRWLQIIGLFTLGLVLGRLRCFETSEKARRTGAVALIAGLLAFPVFQYLLTHVDVWWPRGPVLRSARALATCYRDLSQLLVWVGGFVLLFQWARAASVLRLLIPYGRMSLTCYVTQSLIWIPVYYHFGLGVYRLWGPFYSVAAGAAFFVVHLAAAHWWLRRFHYGPLEWLWRCATLLSFETPFLRTPAQSAHAEPAKVLV